MKHYLISIIILAAAYLSMPWEAVAQGDKDCTDDTLWTRSLLPENAKACRFTPDGKYVLAAVGKTLCKYDALTGELVSRFKDSCDSRILFMELSKKMTIILTTDYNQSQIYIWDYYQEKIIKTIPVKNDSVPGVKYVVLTIDDENVLIGTLKIDTYNLVLYNITTGKELRKLSIEGGIRRIAASPDGRYFVIGSVDYNETEKRFYSHPTLWKTENWELVKELGYFRGEIISLNYSSDGKYLAFACNSGDPEPLYVWDMEKMIKAQEYPKTKTGQSHDKAKFSQDSKYLVLSSGSPPFNLFTLVWDYYNDTLICKYNFPSDDLDVNQIGDNIILTNIIKLISIKPKLIPSSKIDNSEDNPSINIKYINNLINISLTTALPQFYMLEIYDNTAKMIIKINLGYLEKGDHIFVRSVQLSSGIYFATIRFGSNSISNQFEVVR